MVTRWGGGGGRKTAVPTNNKHDSGRPEPAHTLGRMDRAVNQGVGRMPWHLAKLDLCHAPPDLRLGTPPSTATLPFGRYLTVSGWPACDQTGEDGGAREDGAIGSWAPCVADGRSRQRMGPPADRSRVCPLDRAGDDARRGAAVQLTGKLWLPQAFAPRMRSLWTKAAGTTNPLSMEFLAALV